MKPINRHPLPEAARFGFLSLALCLLAACDPLPELAQVELGDVHPPNLQSQEITDEGCIRLRFDEPVRLDPGSLRMASGPDGRGIPLAGRADALQARSLVAADANPSADLMLQVDGTMQAGQEVALEVAVRDSAGNSLSLVLPFYGPNPRPPRLLINELLTKTSTKNRDAIELRVLADGNLGGVSVFLGIPDDFDACYSFPATEVKAGDYLILHCKPEGKPEEVDEAANPSGAAGLASELARSGGLNASPLARDFWWREAPGLPDDSGMVTLAYNPLGSIKDAVFYSNKSTVAGKDYRSFGTKKFLERAENLQARGAWLAAGSVIKVEDAAASGGLTATRTLGRQADGGDTNASADWHVAPSGKASLGTINGNDLYQPAPG